MIIAKCCKPIIPINNVFNTTVSLRYKKLSTKTENGKQINNYSSVAVKSVRCVMKDRTNASVEVAFAKNIQDGRSLKELIFKYSDIKFFLDSETVINEIEWEESIYNITEMEKIKSFTSNYQRFDAPEGQPFIRMFIGLKKL